MRQMKSNIVQINSEIDYNYITIKATQSRIDKGLLAVPVSLIDYFPNKKQQIKVYFDDKNSVQLNFTPYLSSSRECRIGGLKKWFLKNKIRGNDEVVIQILDTEQYVYKIILENNFLNAIKLTQDEFDISQNRIELSKAIEKLSSISNVSQNEVYQKEFHRLSKMSELKRNTIEVSKKEKKEIVPYSIRKLLGEIYKGKCQLTNFTFIQKNGKPYFEIHHINENKGNFLKNLLVVSPNIHAQFTYANKIEQFDKNGWLRKVKFGNDELTVFQYIDIIQDEKSVKEVHL